MSFRAAPVPAWIALVASLGGAPGTLQAIPPALPDYHYYYGPGRACGAHYAFDVAVGEGFEQSGLAPSLYFPGGGMSFEGWIYSGPEYRDIVDRLGTFDLPGGVRLERIRHGSRSSPRVEILYLYDSGARSPFPILSIRSNMFDGSARDLELLGRIRFGEAARAICANTPEALRPTPERENPDAAWLDPRVHAGPLTLCMAGVALDLRAGEAAQLPWSDGWPRFRLLRDGRKVDADLLLWRNEPAPGLSGTLAASDHVALVEGSIRFGLIGFNPDGDEGPLQVMLFRRLPGSTRHLSTMPHLALRFERTFERAERLEIAGRLRVQRPEDACFAAPPLPRAPTSGL
jgi:hypothetical protein